MVPIHITGPLFQASPSSLVLYPQILPPQLSLTLLSVYSTEQYYQVLILFCSLESASRWMSKAIREITLIVSFFRDHTVALAIV